MKKNSLLPLVGSILVANLAGGIGSIFTFEAIPSWYAGLVKPSFSPPNYLFGPVWTTLYFLMGLSAYLIWKSKKKKLVEPALKIYGVQLVLNALWSILFFGLKNPGLAFLEIVLLWSAILTTIVRFAKVNKKASWLLLPYLAWVSFAGMLNLFIWLLNK